MSASTLTTVEFIYKRDYTKDVISDITLRDHVWWAMMPKKDGFVGDSFLYPIRHGNPQGISGTFARAQANAKPSSGKQFRATRAAKFGVITLDGEAILASQGNQGSFYDLVTLETDSVLEELGDALAFDFYRDTTGLRGRVSSISGNQLTLVEPEDARNFKEGMTIIADDTITGASPRAGTTFVVAVDEDGGTVTVDDITDITGSIQVNDYLFRDGDPGTCMQGLEVCTPLSAPVFGSDSFRGQDRGSDANRLAGSRLDDSSLDPHDALGQLAVRISKRGKSRNVDQGFLHPTHFYNVTQALNAKVEYTDGGDSANYGFQSIMIHHAAGSFRVYSDPDCPVIRGRVSRSGSQYIRHLGGLPHIVDLDGKISMREVSSNGIEIRVASFCNLIQLDTAAQGVCSLLSP